MARNMTTAGRRASADEQSGRSPIRGPLRTVPPPFQDLRSDQAFFAAQTLADDRGGPLGDRRLGGLAPGHRLLLGMVLDEVAGRAAELEHRHLAFAALAEAKRHHRRADPGAHVDRTGRLAIAAGLIARAVEAVDVAVAGDLADRKLVKPRQGHLSAMGVAGENERDAVAPQTVGLLGDV